MTTINCVLFNVGTSIKSGDGTVRYFPFDVSDPTGPIRTHKKLVEDAKSAISKDSQVGAYIFYQ